MLGTQQEPHQSPCPQGVDSLPGAGQWAPIGVSTVGGITKGRVGDVVTGQRGSFPGQAAEPDVSNICYMATKMGF